MAAPIDWSTIELCLDSDLRRFESSVIQWTGGEGSAKKWRDLAKTLIGERLDRMLVDLELNTDAADVKDLIGNPAILKTAACYKTLELLANDKSLAPGDLYDRKAERYFALFEEEFSGMSVPMLHLDTDESGTIEDVEKYAGARIAGVRIKHGG